MPSIAEILLGSRGEHVLEFLHRRFAHADIFVRRRAGNVLRGVSRREIQAGVGQRRIIVLGFLEVFDRLIVLTIAIGGDALVEFVASLELVAARWRRKPTAIMATANSATELLFLECRKCAKGFMANNPSPRIFCIPPRGQ